MDNSTNTKTEVNKEEFFDTIFEKHSAIMLLIEPNTGKIINSNKSAENYYGYNKAKFCSMNIDEINTLPKEAIFEKLKSAISKNLENFEFQHKLSSGEFRNVEVNSSPIDYKGKQILFSIIHDINDHKQVEKKLSDQNTLMTTILEKSPIGFAVNTISDGKAIFVSSKFEEIYGIEIKSINNIDDFYEKVYPDPTYREETRKKITEDMLNNDASKMKWENIPITTITGKKIYVTATNIPVPEQDLMVSTVQDVTEIKLDEEVLKDKLEEIEKMNKLMIGRELEMIRLKDEEKKLKEE